MSHIAVIGCGAWATAISIVASQAGNDVKIWCHREGIVQEINGYRKRTLLPEVTIPSSVTATLDMSEAIRGAQALIVCVASPYLVEVVTQLKSCYVSDLPILCLTKGIVKREGGDVSLFSSDIFRSVLGPCPYAVLSGPNLALEIALGSPAAAVVASDDVAVSNLFQSLLSTESFRVYTSSDKVGVSLGGVLKNIMAIASGCVDGLGLGANTKATLLTRGLQEMIRFSLSFGAEEQTLYGLSGLGDVIATCHSTQSRNYQVGFALGSGKSLECIIKDMSVVAEGVNTCRQVFHIAEQKGLSLPITEVLYAVLFDNLDPREGIRQLMSRELKSE